MPIYETYSRRKKRLAGGESDVFTYENIPNTTRVQLLQIFGIVSNHSYSFTEHHVWESARDIMRQELGVFDLSNFGGGLSAKQEVTRWFLSCNDNDTVLDAIQLMFDIISSICKGEKIPENRISLQTCMDDMNARLRQEAIGFEYKDGVLVEIRSEFIHSEAVIPALRLLHSEDYKAADEEFREAHADFRNGDYAGTMLECGKALESVMKVICTKKGWEFDTKDTANKLLEIVFSNGLIPDYLQSHFGSLRSLLSSGVPTLRNKQGGHGGGATPHDVPEHLAAFQLHQTAAAILLLVEAEEALA